MDALGVEMGNRQVRPLSQVGAESLGILRMSKCPRSEV